MAAPPLFTTIKRVVAYEIAILPSRCHRLRAAAVRD